MVKELSLKFDKGAWGVLIFIFDTRSFTIQDLWYDANREILTDVDAKILETGACTTVSSVGHL